MPYGSLKPYCDLRALGLFRVYFGSLLMVDLARRWRHLPELYSDQ